MAERMINMNREKEINLLEESRSRMHRLIDEQYDGLRERIESGRSISVGQMMPKSYSLASSPSVFKGKKPSSIIMPDGKIIAAATWRAAVTEILRDCNADEVRHERIEQLCGNVAGRQRTILGSSSDEMDVPIRIDDGLYFEGKFDTEYLIKMMTERVLDKVGYNYSSIIVTLRPEPPMAFTESEYPELTDEGEGDDQDEGFTPQIM